MSTKQHHVTAGNVTFGNDLPLSIIAGPCQMESRDHTIEVAGRLAEIAKEKGVGLIYKTSYDKANRTSLGGKRGMGLEKSLAVFEEVKKLFGLPTLTDVHEIPHCAAVAPVIDILQIPAFLCRQTDLLIAAANTGRVVNVKKGQFLAPWDMKNVISKVVDSGNPNVMLTERGASFGYNTLVVDMRSLPSLAQMGYPVIMDATHAVQQPGGQGTSSGGQREFVPTIAKAAVSTGIAGVFIETHPDPDNAPSDGPNMVKLADLPALLDQLLAFDKLAKSF